MKYVQYNNSIDTEIVQKSGERSIVLYSTILIQWEKVQSKYSTRSLVAEINLELLSKFHAGFEKEAFVAHLWHEGSKASRQGDINSHFFFRIFSWQSV